MISQLRAALVAFILFTILTGVLYPLAVTVVAQVCFAHGANGSLIEVNGKAVGSESIGQSFTSAKYFWGRPSATSPVADNGASSSGSNLGPTNPDLIQGVTERVAALRAADPRKDNRPIPVDLVTASASGLDPEISPAAAEYQIPRVAKARNLSENEVANLVARETTPRTFGFLGEPRVNVLRLNLALDRASEKSPAK